MQDIDKIFVELTEELRVKNKMTKTKLAQSIWPDFEPQAALMRYQRFLAGRCVTLCVGLSIAKSFSYDFARLIVIATERIEKA